MWEEMGIPPETRTVLEREEREGKGGRVIRGNGIFAAAKGEAEVPRRAPRAARSPPPSI